ncbi:MAG TPA: hypothetical protein PKW66_14585, partial [Polyangiaceae bacterium]|nr:hypothetical protein [Polyangiaceae bacterium]
MEYQKFLPFVSLPFMDAYRNITIDFRSCDLLENRRPVVRGCLEKGRELPLGQEHGAGEPIIVHARRGFDGSGHFPDLSFENDTGIGV